MTGLMSGLIAKLRDAMKYARTVERCQQVVGRGAAVLVQHRVGHVAQIVGRGIAEDQALQHGRHEKADPAARIFEDRQQFLVDERENAQDRFHHGPPHTSRLVVTARASASSTAAMTASTAALGSTTPQILPARNSVCSRFT